MTYRLSFCLASKCFFSLLCRAYAGAWQKVKAVMSTVAHQNTQHKHATTRAKPPKRAQGRRGGMSDTKEKAKRKRERKAKGKIEEKSSELKFAAC